MVGSKDQRLLVYEYMSLGSLTIYMVYFAVGHLLVILSLFTRDEEVQVSDLISGKHEGEVQMRFERRDGEVQI